MAQYLRTAELSLEYVILFVQHILYLLLNHRQIRMLQLLNSLGHSDCQQLHFLDLHLDAVYGITHLVRHRGIHQLRQLLLALCVLELYLF